MNAIRRTKKATFFLFQKAKNGSRGGRERVRKNPNERYTRTAPMKQKRDWAMNEMTSGRAWADAAAAVVVVEQNKKKKF